tara:strand:+ start:610 stop:1797 length:1188 start_codon:yes stop_codon:yes gene_type:complete
MKPNSNLFKSSFIPYGKHNVSQQDIDNVIEVLRGANLTQGETVPYFENIINEVVHSKYSIAVNSATSALHIACRALGLSKEDYMWTTPNTFVASANCGLYCEAKVDFVDIDPNTGLMCINNLKEKLKQSNKNGTLPKIVIPVHLAGNPCDMFEIKELADIYGFRIIEDASHAIGAFYNNEPIGSCKYSDITIFSFHPVKIITTGEGGVATTNEPQLAKKMAALRSHGVIKDPNLFITNSPGQWFYEQQDLGFNYRLSDIHAALGVSQIKRLKEIVRERNYLLKEYKKMLSETPVNFLKISIKAYSSVHLAIIRLKNKDENFHKMVFNGLRKAGIGVQVHYIPVHLHPYYRNLGFKDGDFPEAELYAKNAITLPLYPGLAEKDQTKVVEVLKNLLK